MFRLLSSAFLISLMTGLMAQPPDCIASGPWIKRKGLGICKCSGRR